jgi:hypothetical protein
MAFGPIDKKQTFRSDLVLLYPPDEAECPRILGGKRANMPREVRTWGGDLKALFFIQSISP